MALRPLPSLGSPGQQTGYSPDLEPGIVSRLLTPPLSGLAYIGSMLDKYTGARAARGILDMATGGDTPVSEAFSFVPFSDALGITDENNTAYTRDVLENLGAPKNEEGFHPFDDPMDAVFDTLGFAGDVAINPVGGPVGAGLRFGNKALSPAGKLAKAAGVLPEGGAARFGGTIKDVVDDLMNTVSTTNYGAGQEAQAALHSLDSLGTAAKVQHGFGSLNDLMASPLATERLGGAWRAKLPFMDEMFGSGEAAARAGQAIADKTPAMIRDPIANVAGWTGRKFNQLFDPRVRDASDEMGQATMRGYSDDLVGIKAGVRKQAGKMAQQLDEAGLNTPDAGEQIQRILEGTESKPIANPVLDEITGKMGTDYRNTASRLDRYGHQFDALSDPGVVGGADKVYELGRQIAKASKAGEATAAQGDATDRLVAAMFKSPYATETTAGGAVGDFAAIRAHLAENAGDLIAPENLDHVASQLASLTPDQLIDGNYPLKSIIDYGSRGMVGAVNKATRKAMGFQHPSDVAREEILKSVAGGTHTIQEISKDIHANGLVGDASQIEGLIATKYGNKVPAANIEPMSKFLSTLEPEQLAAGTFGRHPVILWQEHEIATKSLEAGYEHAYKGVAQLARPPGGYAGQNTTSLGELFRKINVKAGDPAVGAIRDISEKMGIPWTPDLTKMEIPTEYADSLTRFIKGFTEPESVSDVRRVFDSYMNLWKASVLTRPARYTRDFMSAIWNLHVAGDLSKESFDVANSIIKNGSAKGLAKALPHLGKTDDEVYKAIQNIAYSTDLLGHYRGTEIFGGSAGFDTLDDVLSKMPGTNPHSWKNSANKLAGQLGTTDTTWNPLKAGVRGVGDATHTTFAPIAAGDDIGWYTDSVTRLTGLIDQLKKGVDPVVAAQKVKDVLFDYSADNFTQFERTKMVGAFPFYRFMKGAVPWTLRELAENPGGYVANTARESYLNRDEMPMPGNVSRSLAIPAPWGSSAPDGTKKFITSLGLMYEDPMNLVQVGRSPWDTIQKTGAELGGRLNPAAKAVIEVSTGRSLFSQGRDIQDLDPGFGRAIANVKQAYAGVKQEAPEIGGTTGEYFGPMVPFMGTTAQIARTATDPRKNFLEKAMNILTGIKVTDVSPESQRRVINELARESARDLGAKNYENTFLPQDRRASMDPATAAEIDRLLQLGKRPRR